MLQSLQRRDAPRRAWFPQGLIHGRAAHATGTEIECSFSYFSWVLRSASERGVEGEVAAGVATGDALAVKTSPYPPHLEGKRAANFEKCGAHGGNADSETDGDCLV